MRQAGSVLRDLFNRDNGGWLQDAALLDRLAREKLERAAEEIRAEGWKWSEIAIDFPYGHTTGLRRLPGTQAPVTEEEQVRYDAAVAEYNRLSEENESADELPEDADQRMAELEAEIASIVERPSIYDRAEIARAGVFVSIDHDGRLKVERGFVRPEDEARKEGGALAAAGKSRSGAQSGADDTMVGADTQTGPVSSEPAEEEVETSPKLSGLMVVELSAHRTVAMRLALASDPQAAFLAATHALALNSFYGANSHSCLDLSERSVTLGSHAPGIGDSLAARTLFEVIRQLADASARRPGRSLVLASRSGRERSGRTLRPVRGAQRQCPEHALGETNQRASARRSTRRTYRARHARLLERQREELPRQGHQGAHIGGGAGGEGQRDGGDDRSPEEGGHGR